MSDEAPTLAEAARKVVAGWDQPGKLAPAVNALRASLAAHEQRGLDLTLSLDVDPSPECPAEHDGMWRLYSFSRDNGGTAENVGERRRKELNLRPSEPSAFLTDGGKPQGWLAQKLRAGLAWPLRAPQHGGSCPCDGCPWSRLRELAGLGEAAPGEANGYLVWEEPTRNLGAKTKAARREDAEGFLATWNAWAKGWVYAYSLECDPCNGDRDRARGNRARFFTRCRGLFRARLIRRSSCGLH